MSGKAAYSSPLGPRESISSTGSNFNSFAKPLGQFSPRQFSSPSSSSPSSAQEGDFIPLGYSSPIKHPSQRGRGNWKGSRRSSNSPANSGFNSSCSPYTVNRPQKFSFNRRSRGGHGNSSSTSYSDDISLYVNHSMVEDPWSNLEKKLKNSRNSGASTVLTMSDSYYMGDSQGNQSSTSSDDASS
ncbi:uncharacterized protein LOC126473431 [Schistocerca serialis cubense]|uniref:uncharacterized protein LOC126473431 n=1 Tax=Schistocerca serialis cubense TaxID=2023355 RepID=UPI00214F38FF|nr:uncharacterized protein LOC126473431 [Schistocerca serialis cubense]